MGTSGAGGSSAVAVSRWVEVAVASSSLSLAVASSSLSLAVASSSLSLGWSSGAETGDGSGFMTLVAESFFEGNISPRHADPFIQSILATSPVGEQAKINTHRLPRFTSATLILPRDMFERLAKILDLENTVAIFVQSQELLVDSHDIIDLDEAHVNEHEFEKTVPDLLRSRSAR